MITIVDFGMGNLRSVQKAFERIGRQARIAGTPDAIDEASLVVVPGVGAFDRAVKNLHENDLWDPLCRYLDGGRPYLGICLGMQLLFEGSEEGTRPGLGHFAGSVRRFRNVRLVPHMGWNDLRWVREGEALRPPEGNQPCYYFVHSYHAVPEDDRIVAGLTEYGSEFCSAVRRNNCFGVQFHPEKSQYAGLHLLKTFCETTLRPSAP